MMRELGLASVQQQHKKLIIIYYLVNASEKCALHLYQFKDFLDQEQSNNLLNK